MRVSSAVTYRTRKQYGIVMNAGHATFHSVVMLFYIIQIPTVPKSCIFLIV